MNIQEISKEIDSHPIWAEVDLNAIANNIREVRRIAGDQRKVMAVVKANAYGHGAIEVSKTALGNGADFLGVARLNEAIELREAGIEAPLLILGYTPAEAAETLSNYDLTQTIYSLEMAQAFSKNLSKIGKSINIHLKIDTGMGRLGLIPHNLSDQLEDGKQSKAVQDAIAISALNNLKIEGVFTHFASSDSFDKKSAKNQFKIFMEFLNILTEEGLEIPIRHAANSAAIIDMPETHLDMVRSGIMTYGLYPSEEVDKSKAALKPAMTLKAMVGYVKEVPAGFKVSYGSTYETKAPARIATVPVGYADGYSRLLSSCEVMLVNGIEVPVLGRVTMDQAMLDVSKLKSVSSGDEVVVFGKQGDSMIPVEKIANTTNTINYEIVSTIMPRVPRIYC